MQFRKTLLSLLASLALVAGLALTMGAAANAAPAQPTQAPQVAPSVSQVVPTRWVCNWGWHNGYWQWDWRWNGFRWVHEWFWHPWWGNGCFPTWR